MSPLIRLVQEFNFGALSGKPVHVAEDFGRDVKDQYDLCLLRLSGTTDHSPHTSIN